MPNFFVILENVGRLCLGSGCNYGATVTECTCLLPSLTRAFFKKCVFIFVSIFRCKKIHNLTCWARHSDHRTLKKGIIWSPSDSHPTPTFSLPPPSLPTFQLLITTPPSALLHFQFHIKTWGWKKKFFLGSHTQGIVSYPRWILRVFHLYLSIEKCLELKKNTKNLNV